MNILLLNWRDPKNPKAGGAELVTMEHVKAWIIAGHHVVWLATTFRNSKSVEVLEGVTIIRKGNVITVFLHAFFLYLFSGMRFDLVVDEIHGIPFFTPLYVRKPKLVFIHEVANEIWDYMYPFPISVLGRLLEKLLLLPYRNTSFLTVSQSTKEELIGLSIRPKKIYVILNGLANEVVNTLSKKEKNKTFIFVSRVVKMKGIEEVVKAFAFLVREDESAQLWIVGKGESEYIEKLKKMAREYGIARNVTFLGAVSEKEKLSLMRKAHLLLHASVKEGWGLVVVEAASQGTPSVVYNVPGLRDSVQEGKTGIVLSTNSPREMAAQALSLIGNSGKYKKFQKNGLAWAKSLSWKEATRQSLMLLEKVVKQ